MKHLPADASRPAFWREWGPVAACALLTGAGLYMLTQLGAPLASVLLLALALACPLAVTVFWLFYRHRF